MICDMSVPQHKPGQKPRFCGCKGIRSCRLCCSETTEFSLSEPHINQKQRSFETGKCPQIHREYKYCLSCKKVCLLNCSLILDTGGKYSEGQVPSYSAQDYEGRGSPNTCSDAKLLSKDCSEHVNKALSEPAHMCVANFQGIEVVEHFVTPEEEDDLVLSINQAPFINSQSGRRKQDFGPKVNFKKKKLRTANFNGLPLYSHVLYERMKALPSLSDFEPVELCNLEYLEERGAHIDPHFDDSWLWGERLVTLNLLSDSVLTFSCDAQPHALVRIPLPRRSLLIVSSSARYVWKHAIDPAHIHNKRLAMTFRELSKEFLRGGGRADEGYALLELALTFKGCAVGSQDQC